MPDTPQDPDQPGATPLDFFRANRPAPADGAWMQDLTDLHAEAGIGADWAWEASRYLAHPFVVEAVNVAIALGKPLLVTGDPGVGKTALANAVAWQLGLGAPEKFVAKSTSEARDLFYAYDALARFHAIEVAKSLPKPPPPGTPRRFAEPENPRLFIEYQGLGRAILNAQPPEEITEFLLHPPHATPSGPPLPGDYLHPGTPRKSVVLIDEIDKASSDFCNDLLDEFDRLQFTVPEISNRPTPELDRALRPVVIITSNRERELPPAFLRRCVFAHIPLPDRLPQDHPAGTPATPGAYRIENILALRLGQHFVYSRFATSVLQLVDDIRRRHPQKPPSTAEIIELLQYCQMRGADWAGTIHDQRDLHDYTLAILGKTEPDHRILRAELERNSPSTLRGTAPHGSPPPA